MNGLFIVGYWNSGTTLLTDVLRKHPDLSLKKGRFLPNLEERTLQKLFSKMGTPFFDFGDYSEVIENGFANYRSPEWSEEQMHTFRKMFDRHFSVSPGQHLLLKNQWLFFYKEWIDRQFAKDNIKKIVILRNGYAQAVSKDYWMRGDLPPEKQLVARSIFWRKAMEYYFETWYKDPDCLTLRYENLCTHPEDTIETICSFLSLPFEPLQRKLPEAFVNRMTKWLQLEPAFQQQVIQEIKGVQNRIDDAFPLKTALEFFENT